MTNIEECGVKKKFEKQNNIVDSYFGNLFDFLQCIIALCGNTTGT